MSVLPGMGPPDAHVAQAGRITAPLNGRALASNAFMELFA